jgi:hypothetical protein
MNKFLFTLLFISIFTSGCRQMGKEGAELLSNKATSKAISRSISKVESEAEVLASKAGKTESKISPNNLGRDEFLVAKQLENKWIAKCKNIAKQQVIKALINSATTTEQQFQSTAETAVSSTFTQCLNEAAPNQSQVVNLAQKLVVEIQGEISRDLANKKNKEESVQLPLGTFSDGTWLVSLNYQEGVYYYAGTHLSSGQAINLSGGQVTQHNSGKFYNWKNDGYNYNVGWNPAAPNSIRLQVVSPDNKEILNRVLLK